MRSILVTRHSSGCLASQGIDLFVFLSQTKNILFATYDKFSVPFYDISIGMYVETDSNRLQLQFGKCYWSLMPAKLGGIRLE